MEGGVAGVHMLAVKGGLCMYIPAGWVAYMRVLSGEGDNNAVHGLRASFITKDAEAVACIKSLQALKEKGKSCQELMPLEENMASALAKREGM